MKIIDVNDNVPSFQGVNLNGNYETAVTEETEIGDFVIKVVAFDLDGTSPNNLVKYYFPSYCEDCAAFNINNDTGRITAAQTFTRSEQDEYRVLVTGYDGADSSFNPPGPNEGEA